MLKVALRVASAITLVSISAIVGLAPAKAATISWNFSPSEGHAAGNLSCAPCTYSEGGYSITAEAFTSTQTWTAEHLYEKTGSGDEHGLGINSDPTGDHEIYGTFHAATMYTPAFGTHFIQIGIGSLSAVTNIMFEMGSSTQKEGWAVYGQTTQNGPLTFLTSGTSDEVWTNLALGYAFYDFFYDSFGHLYGQGDNVLLSGIQVTTDCPPGAICTRQNPAPLPGAIWLFGTVIAGAAGVGGWRRNKRQPASGSTFIVESYSALDRASPRL